MIERESWRIIEMIIRRYPDKKKEYQECIIDIMGCSMVGEFIGCVIDLSQKSTTESKALKINSDYIDRMKKEIYAVETVYKGLQEEEQKLMKERFWTDRKRNIPYLDIKTVRYSERQMKRIVSKIIYQVGKYLGEVK